MHARGKAGPVRSYVMAAAGFAAAMAAGMAMVPEPAGAVLAGTNGRIVFVSGRGEPNDATAKIYLRTVLSGVGAGAAGPTVTPAPGVQHRHPTWSPDRTKIAYARGGSNCAAPKCDIYILDLTIPGATPVNITNTTNVNEDRPAWSPDGTRIAYESELTDGSGQLDILVAPAAQGTSVPTLNLTNSAGVFDSKPAWSPDSQTIYYGRGNPFVAPSGPPPVSVDILKRPADGSGTASLAVPDSGVHEFQPSISPDGTKICFTLGTGFDANAATMVAPLTEPPTAGAVLAGETGGNYNCTWSPDGNRIAYVNGIFSNGALVMKNSDLSGGFVVLEETPARFDGNPDWAPDGRPGCEDASSTTTTGVPVEIVLGCEDTGPDYERTPVTVDVPTDAEPANGTLGNLEQGPPARVTYSPAAGFTGVDSFQVRARDAAGFGTPRGTVTISVTPADTAGEPSNDFKVIRVKRNRRKGTARLVIRVPGPGVVRLKRTKRVKRARERAERAGRVVLRLRPRGPAKRALERRGKARVVARMTFRPDGGSPRTKRRRVKLVKR